MVAKEPRYNLTIPLTIEEHVILIDEAQKSALSRSEYARRRIFGRRVVARKSMIDTKGITLLKQLCGLVKQIYKSERVAPEITRKMLDDAKKLLHTLEVGIIDKSKKDL